MLSKVRHQTATGPQGLSILEMGEDSVRKMSFAFDQMIRDAGRTGQHHDLAIPLEHRDSRLTIHINDNASQQASDKLRSHMLYRKYAQRAGKWFGLLLEPTTGKLRLGFKVRAPYAFDFELEASTANAAPLQKIDNLRHAQRKRRRVGRNEPCTCGSGKKFKRCSLN
ncbi:MAG: hypothetical protein ACI8Q6_000764 [Granulosicoccus sp.]|jgi:hypothetical protein